MNHVDCVIKRDVYPKKNHLCSETIFGILRNSLPNDKISDVTKLKAFADDKLNVARIMIYLLDRVENTVGNEENAGYQYFLFYLPRIPKPSSLGL